LSESLAFFESTGDGRSMILVLDNLANTHVNLAELDRALSSTRIAGVAPRRSATSSISEGLPESGDHLCPSDGGGRASNRTGVRATQQLPWNAHILGFALWIARSRWPHLGLHKAAAQILGFTERFWTKLTARYGRMILHTAIRSSPAWRKHRPAQAAALRESGTCLRSPKLLPWHCRKGPPLASFRAAEESWLHCRMLRPQHDVKNYARIVPIHLRLQSVILLTIA